MSTKIEWTDETWNPVTGCQQVSPGCDHCYAKTWAGRQMGEWKGRAFEQVRCHEDRLEIPARRKKPTRFFVNSMSDLFHKDVPDEFIEQVFLVMLGSPQHTFQVLTKRPERMRRFIPSFLRFFREPKNAWLGVSVENAGYKWRIDMLRETPAAIRFLSIEPLLGDVGELNLDGIHWVIVGGESGPGARPMHQQWALSILRQCEAANVPFFFKQWGEWKPLGTLNGIIPLVIGDKRRAVVFRDGTLVTDKTLLTVPAEKYARANAEMIERVGKKKAGRELAGRTWDEYPVSA